MKTEEITPRDTSTNPEEGYHNFLLRRGWLAVTNGLKYEHAKFGAHRQSDAMILQYEDDIAILTREREAHTDSPLAVDDRSSTVRSPLADERSSTGFRIVNSDGSAPDFEAITREDWWSGNITRFGMSFYREFRINEHGEIFIWLRTGTYIGESISCPNGRFKIIPS